MAIRAVVFDYGGVLTNPVRDSIAAWLARDGITPESFSTTLKAWLGRDVDDGTPIHRLETGELPPEDFNALFAHELTTRSGEPVLAEGLLSRLFAEMVPDPAMFALVQDLKSAGIRTAILSNSWGNTYPRDQLGKLFDALVISSEVRMRKPHAPIFELTLDQLGVTAGEAVFIDDAEPNLVGARAVGLTGLLHRDAPATRAALTELIPELGVPNP